MRQLLLPQLDLTRAPEPLGRGVNASPGAAVGAVVFTADEAERLGKAGEHVILVRDETTPDDFHGMVEAQGILTARGGKTSHAAIVAVGMGKPAVCGVTAIRFLDDGSIRIGEATFREGDRMTIDGTTGTVFAGDAPLVPPDPNNPYLATILEWADRARTMSVRANADTPEDATRAREFGAAGHRPLPHGAHVPGRRPPADRAEHDHGRGRRGPGAATSHKLRAFQQSDFEGIFRAMAGLPVTIRLLDPPLHEFLPDLIELSERVAVSKATGTPDPEAYAQIAAVRQMHEVNPMLGTRGCRLGIEWPDVYRMQVAAIMSAACTIKRETGAAPIVEIMIPLVGFEEELRIMRAQVIEVAEIVLIEQKMEVEYAVGTMIELPRAALRARRDRPRGRLLLLRHQRPHPDDPRLQPRRRREQVPHPLPAEQRHHLQPVRDHRPGGGRKAGGDGGRRRARRAARGSSWASAASTGATRPVGDVLPPGGPRLRLVLALPRPDGAHRRRPRRPRRRLRGAPWAPTTPGTSSRGSATCWS